MAFSSHIAVLAFPFGTHAAPLLTLVQRLAASAPDVMFSFLNTSSSNKSIFSGAEFDNIKPYDVWDGVPDGHVLSGNHHEPVELFLKVTPDNFEKALKEAEVKVGMGISCFLSDAFLWFVSDWAEKIGVPWVAFWTAASCSLSTHLHTDVIRSAVAASDSKEKAEKTLEFIPGLSAMHLNDLQDELLKDDSQSIFAYTLHNMGLKLPTAAAVVLNSFEEIDPIISNDLKSKLQKFLNVGPFTLSTSITPKSDENNCLKWLDSQQHVSVVYISFGSVISPPPNEMVALAEALETKKIPFLWSLREYARKHLPEGFNDRICKYGKIVSWAPQMQVLAHSSIGVFVTHCGWNSILESIRYGVPLICRPFFGDQKPNSRMVQDAWRIGIQIEGGVFNKSGTISALELILFDDKGKEIRKNVLGIKEKALDAAKPNGSSTRNFEELSQLLASMPKWSTHPRTSLTKKDEKPCK